MVPPPDITLATKEFHVAKNSKGQAKKPKQEKPKTNVAAPSQKGTAGAAPGTGNRK